MMDSLVPWMLAVLTLIQKMDVPMNQWILNVMMAFLVPWTPVFQVMKMRMRMVVSTLLMIVYAMILLIALITSVLLMMIMLTMQDVCSHLLMKVVMMVSRVLSTLVDQKDANTKTTTLCATMELLARKTCAIFPMKMLMKTDVLTKVLTHDAMMDLLALLMLATQTQKIHKTDALMKLVTQNATMDFDAQKTHVHHTQMDQM